MFAAIRNLFAPAARREKFVVLAFRLPEGVTSEVGAALRGLLNSTDCDGWWFLNPSSFQVFFLATRGGANGAAQCRKAVRKLCQDARVTVQFGQPEGELIAKFDSSGHLSSARRR